MKFLTNAIQPPPGYENVPMDWPKPKHTGPGYPSFTFGEYQAVFLIALLKQTHPILFLAFISIPILLIIGLLGFLIWKFARK